MRDFPRLLSGMALTATLACDGTTPPVTSTSSATLEFNYIASGTSSDGAVAWLKGGTLRLTPGQQVFVGDVGVMRGRRTELVTASVSNVAQVP